MKKNNSYRYPKTQRESINGLRHYNINDKEKLPSVLRRSRPRHNQPRSAPRWPSGANEGEEEATRIVDESAARGTAMHKILREIYFRRRLC